MFEKKGDFSVLGSLARKEKREEKRRRKRKEEDKGKGELAPRKWPSPDSTLWGLGSIISDTEHFCKSRKFELAL